MTELSTPSKGVLPPEIIGLTPNVWTAPFWEAANEHRLVIPRCRACSTLRFPPSPFCWSCRAQDVEWIAHDGRGLIYSFTVIRHAVIPPVADALPVVAAVVELDATDGCRLVANVVDAAPEEVVIGRVTDLDWYDVRPGCTIPVVRLRPAVDA